MPDAAESPVVPVSDSPVIEMESEASAIFKVEETEVQEDENDKDD